MMVETLVDTRTGLNPRHTLSAQLGQSVCSRLAGYEYTNDAGILCLDPPIRQVVGKPAKERKAAATSKMGRFETAVLTQCQNLRAHGFVGSVNRSGDSAKTKKKSWSSN